MMNIRVRIREIILIFRQALKLVPPALLFLFYLSSCDQNGPGPNGGDETERQITILYTNDEHGWMESTGATGGAAEMVGLWRSAEDYSDDAPILILSGGDMWTGPAISTWFQGESMLEVMNAMGYDAAAIGNHEFDFKVEGLEARLAQSDFPFLSANIREKAGGGIPDFALPYIVREVNGIQVGLIGLTTTSTPTSAFPDYVEDYDFIPYEDALEDVVPQVKEEGAELIIVIAHICYHEIQTLAATAAELGIAVMGGGHCHERFAEMVGDMAIIESGDWLQAYAKVDITFDIDADAVVSMKVSTHNNAGGTADPDVAALVEQWSDQEDAALSEVIGYTDSDIRRSSPAMHNMVTDAWLAAFPLADISATNRGGFRQDIPAGDITLGTIVGVLPFENAIVELNLTGVQVIDYIEDEYPVVGGMTTIGGYFHGDGTPLAFDSTYLVLVTDYMYSSSDTLLSVYDPDAYATGINWREPVIDWIRVKNTSIADPLESYLDSEARQ
jgi:2',3'-cyclic-nucleotide 2'-phosphodiesterase (5'-nucleotidase family)